MDHARAHLCSPRPTSGTKEVSYIIQQRFTWQTAGQGGTLGAREAHLQHPGSRVGAGWDGVHALVGLEVVHQLLRLIARGAAVDGTPAPLQQQQLIERLQGSGMVCQDAYTQTPNTPPPGESLEELAL